MDSASNRRNRAPRAAKAAVAIGSFLLLISAVACSYEAAAPVSSDEQVERVIDGDTIALAGGTVVRLVQIDAPEVRGSECYADEATATLTDLIPPGTRVRIETDLALDQQDRYGRRLAYVFKEEENVNKTLLERGAASVWFYGGDRGRYAEKLLVAAQEAQAAGRGLWGACEATLDPSRAIGTRHLAAAAATLAPPPPPSPLASTGSDGCHPSYEPCLPIVDDLNCSAVEALGQAPVRVSGSDPYHLDGDGDGTGCQ
jgi:micrococcal nuclease